MRQIATIAALAVAAAFLVNTAMAMLPGELPGEIKAPSATSRTLNTDSTKTKRVAPPKRVEANVKPLVLPNIGALTTRLWKADRADLRPQLIASKRVLRFWRHHRWILAPRHHKCWQVPWQRSCTVARASARLHAALATVARQRLDHEIPLINDWKTAVHWVQKIYPGTESWMLYISDREGGWGPWVWYGGHTWAGYHIGDDFLGMDTVGGWMQFRYSTFAPYWRHAQEDLREKGYIIPKIPMPPEGGDPEYAGWLSPLAQALTAGYMRYTDQDACHWCL